MTLCVREMTLCVPVEREISGFRFAYVALAGGARGTACPHGEGNALRFLDVLESVDEDIPERMEKEENIEKLYGYIEKNLTEREKLIIRLRYGVSEGKGTPEHPEITQREIAKQLGISRSYVSRIEKKALQKLRRAYDYGRRKN